MFSLTLPGSKSLTNRDLILAALAPGITTLTGVLESDDTQYMMQALQQLGFVLEKDEQVVTVTGGIEHLRGNGQTLFLGNSGTSTRFLTGLALLNSEGTITITGNERMCQRPIADQLDGMHQLGVKTESNNGCPPVIIHPSTLVSVDTYPNEIAMSGESSSQYFTAMLHVAPLLKKGLTINVIGDLVSKPYIDMTINEMVKFGVQVKNENYKKFYIEPQQYAPRDLLIEGDASALSYPVAYLCLHGGQITIQNIGSDSKQGDYKFLDVCSFFGLTYTSDGITTKISAPGVKNWDGIKNHRSTEHCFDFEAMPDVSLTFMILAPFLPGRTHITGLQTLNLKECLRINAMGDGLRQLGVDVEYTEESITIATFGDTVPSTPVTIVSHDDHRIAMSFGILGSYTHNVIIDVPSCVSKTYPKFWEDLEEMRNYKG